MAEEETLKIEERHGYLWVLLPPDITYHNYRGIEEKIMSYLSGSGNRVVLDFERVMYLYSSGIGLLVRLQKNVTDSDGMLCLVNVSKKINKVFSSNNLDRLFPIYPTDVEFEISRDDFWKKKLSKESLEFVFITQIEKNIYRITISGSMDALHDLSRVSEFKPDKDIRHFLFNFEDLGVMDTYGSQLFLELVESIGKQGGVCITYGANEMVRELMSMLNIDALVKHCDSEKEALEEIDQLIE